MNSIEGTVRAYFDAFNHSDVDGIVAVFAPDGSVMADEMETVTGSEPIRQTYAGAFKAMGFQTVVTIDRVLEQGDMATVQAHATGTMTMLATNNTVPLPTHRELFALRKKSDGTWLITDYMFNYPVGRTA